LNLDEVTSTQIALLTEEIENNANTYQSLLEKINRLLMLIWNTNRTDLIEKLSIAKETVQRVLNMRIGNPKTEVTSSTGLFGHFEQRLSAVYGGADNQQDIETLDDDEPALEALAKFSIWYLRDYWEIGLLPKITDPQHLIFRQERQLDEHPSSFREKLYQEVQANLKKLQLSTVKDLKQREIFSRATLKEYIQKHKHLLE
jgi:hypothetical protein